MERRRISHPRLSTSFGIALLALSLSPPASMATGAASYKYFSMHSGRQKVKYPQFSGIPNSDAFNKRIRSAARKMMDTIQSADPGGTPATSIFVTMCTADLVSIDWKVLSNDTGSFFTDYSDITYSPRQSRDIKLSDIFRPSVDYKKVLAVLATRHLVNFEGARVSSIEALVGVNSPPIDHFTVGRRSLDLYLPPTPMGSLSAEEIVVTIPLSTVANLVNPKSPVYELASKSKKDLPSLKANQLNKQLAEISVQSYTQLIKTSDDADAYLKRAEAYEVLGQTALASADREKATSLQRKSDIAAGIASTPLAITDKVPEPPDYQSDGASINDDKKNENREKRKSQGVYFGILVLFCLGILGYCAFGSFKKKSG
ncbi:MAG TPA: hypothetical protein V6C72_07855 [Chroococcales cyanobacterium]